MNASKGKAALFIGMRVLVPLFFLLIAITDLLIKEYLDAGIFLLAFGFIGYRNYRAASTDMSSIILYNCWCLLFMGYLEYKDYSKRKKEAYYSQFGLPLNAMRRSAGAPVIPIDWHQDPYPSSLIFWNSKDGSFGHVKKMIFMDSLSRYIEWEEDRYKLRDPGKDTGYVVIRVYYYPHKKIGSKSYAYEHGFDNSPLSQQQADSIFKAEGIQKDY